MSLLGPLGTPTGGSGSASVALTPEVQEQVTNEAAAAAQTALQPAIDGKLDKGPNDATPRVVQGQTLVPLPPVEVDQATKDQIAADAAAAAQTALAPTIAAKADAAATTAAIAAKISASDVPTVSANFRGVGAESLQTALTALQTTGGAGGGGEPLDFGTIDAPAGLTIDFGVI